jgi:hypothetical protein
MTGTMETIALRDVTPCSLVDCGIHCQQLLQENSDAISYLNSNNQHFDNFPDSSLTITMTLDELESIWKWLWPNPSKSPAFRGYINEEKKHINRDFRLPPQWC